MLNFDQAVYDLEIYTTASGCPYVKFNTEYFKQVHEYFKSKVITETKGALNYSIKYKGVRIITNGTDNKVIVE